MQLTWFDSNSWLIEIGGKRILLDPWLVGSLTFGNLNWLFEGKKRTPQPIPQNIDYILLSQGLEDHAHPATLKELDKNIPVIASENATKVCQGLEYSQITTLKHHQSHIIDETIEITALPGSPVGPTLVENGYIIRDIHSDNSIYYEPHGFHAEAVQKYSPVKTVITPVTNINIPLLGPVIKGQKSALQICQWLKPSYIIPTAGGGDIDFKGFLVNLLKEEGTKEDLERMLASAHLTTQILNPQPYQPLNI